MVDMHRLRIWEISHPVLHNFLVFKLERPFPTPTDTPIDPRFIPTMLGRPFESDSM
jgi:hypothetical protein